MAEIAEEMAIRKTTELFLLFSLGSQFDHLIAMQMAKLGVFCLVADPFWVTSKEVAQLNPKGIILSGGPVSVYRDPPSFDTKIFDLGIPILGICLGFQLWAQHVGCEVVKAEKREFGVHDFMVECSTRLFIDCVTSMMVLESHGDMVTVLKDSKFKILGNTKNTPVSAAQYKHLWGVQFHPEVTETTFGPQIFHNFVFQICGAKDKFPAKDVAQQKIIELRKEIADDKVLLALSGGSDSSVLAYLLKKAMVGKFNRLRAIYIKGIDRPDDEAHVLEYFGNQDWLDLKVVDATKKFLETLRGIESSQKKRVAMRSVYKLVLTSEAKKFSDEDPLRKVFIAQGTLYTDISESGQGYQAGVKKAQIKLHHNVGLKFAEPELLPLSDQVKDTARDIGRAIGVPEALLSRHPFPGPGLIVRIEGAITDDNLRIARHLDGIFIDELRQATLYEKVWQAGVRVTTSTTTCTKGDDAASGLVVIPWGVWSVNGFTAQAAEFPWDFMKRVSKRMTNEVREVGCVCFRTSDKPPATIEFE